MNRFYLSLYRALGTTIAIGVMEALAILAGEPMSRVPFVTSIVLAMTLPDSEPAQPRAIVGGHVLSTLAGLAALAVLGQGETASAVAVGLAGFLMIASRTLHPPAGIDAFLVANYGLPAAWLFNPVLIGAFLLAGFAHVWRLIERGLFLPAERAAAPQMWSLERIKALTRPWRARR